MKTVALLSFCLGVVLSALAQDQAMPGFIAGCAVRDDSNFPGTSEILLVHEIGQLTTTIFARIDDELVPFAWMHQPSENSDSYLESTGGVEGAHIAGAVYRSLIASTFYFRNDWKSAATGLEVGALPQCQFDYASY